MSTATASKGGRRRKRAHEEEEHENEERWLVSFADMMTLLFCLFMVLFAISSVNTSKFEALQRSLKDAFSGAVLDGGKKIIETGSKSDKTESAPEPALTPLETLQQKESSKDPVLKQAAQRQEQDELEALKRRIDKLVQARGLGSHVETVVGRPGLMIRLLTDGVFFDSGSAELRHEAFGILDAVGKLVRDERRHPVAVEGHTDNVPLNGGTYPSNWELSGARAASVVRRFERDGVNRRRMSVVGYADQHPIATNSTAAGRAHNRRIEIVLERINT